MTCISQLRFLLYLLFSVIVYYDVIKWLLNILTNILTNVPAIVYNPS